MSEDFRLSPFQNRALGIPEKYDVFLGGGRGGGKSYTMALLALRHVEQYGARARVLYIRQTYKGLADFETITRDLFFAAYGLGARLNHAEHVWRFPNAAYFELGQIGDASDYAKFQGRSFTMLLIDEAGQFANPDLVDRLRANLRAPKGVPVRMAMAGNPGDPGHQWIAQRYVFRGAPWQPFHEPASGRQWVYAPSTFVDNPFVDRDAYRRQLESSCPTDDELRRAWLEGDWTVARGAYFAGVLSEERCAIGPWDSAQLPRDFAKRWRLYLAHDFGVSAPSCTYIVATSPGAEGPDGRWYPRDSVLLLAELGTNEPDNLNKGLGYTIPRLAEEIVQLAKHWKMRPRGVADDACFARHGHGAGSIADEFRAYGVYFEPARKADRRTGWERMRRMLEAAGKPDQAGLYVSRACKYFWATVPYLARDPRHPDDLDSRAPDHSADACRYAVLYQRRTGRVRELEL